MVETGGSQTFDVHGPSRLWYVECLKMCTPFHMLTSAETFSDQLRKAIGQETELILYSRGVHLGDAPAFYKPLVRPEDYHPRPHIQPAVGEGFHITGTLALDSSRGYDAK
jgi:hypothetical protein